jgi:hypothetical protein
MTTQTVQALDVQGLEKSYDELRVLRGVDDAGVSAVPARADLGLQAGT